MTRSQRLCCAADAGAAGVDDCALRQQQQQLESMRALDLGCGNGLFCCMLASGGLGQVVGVDYADSAVELAQGVRSRLIRSEGRGVGAQGSDLMRGRR